MCVRYGDLSLLYVGISPHAPAAAGKHTSRSTLRQRLHQHYRGNASASTLRLTLGTLLGIPLQASSSGRLTFGPREAELNLWMSDNAFVTWVVTPAPWLVEPELIASLDLLLNLDMNRGHPFWRELSRVRREARVQGRSASS